MLSASPSVHHTFRFSNLRKFLSYLFTMGLGALTAWYLYLIFVKYRLVGTATWMVAVSILVLLVASLYASLRWLPRLSETITLTESGITYQRGSASQETIAWQDIAAIKRHPFLDLWEIYAHSTDRVIKVSTAISGFEIFANNLHTNIQQHFVAAGRPLPRLWPPDLLYFRAKGQSELDFVNQNRMKARAAAIRLLPIGTIAAIVGGALLVDAAGNWRMLGWGALYGGALAILASVYRRISYRRQLTAEEYAHLVERNSRPVYRFQMQAIFIIIYIAALIVFVIGMAHFS